jgi:hypothetical protein
MQANPAKIAFDRCDKLLSIDRLEQVGIGPGTVSRNAAFESSTGSQDNNTHIGIIPDVLCKHYTVLVGQAEVKDDKLTGILGDLLVELQGTSGPDDFIAAERQCLHEAFTEIEVIFNDDDPVGGTCLSANRQIFYLR